MRGSSCHGPGDLSAFFSALRHPLPGLGLGLPTRRAPFLTTASLQARASPPASPVILIWGRRPDVRPPAGPRGQRQCSAPGLLREPRFQEPHKASQPGPPHLISTRTRGAARTPVTCLQTITNSSARLRPEPPFHPPGQVRGATRRQGGQRGCPRARVLESSFAAWGHGTPCRGTPCAVPGFHSLPSSVRPSPQVPAAPPAVLLTQRGPLQEAARRRSSASLWARPPRGLGRRCPVRPPTREVGRRSGSRLREAAASPQAGNRPRPPPGPQAPATGKWRRTAATRRGRAAAPAAGPAPHSALCAAAAASSPPARGPRCPPPAAPPQSPQARCSP